MDKVKIRVDRVGERVEETHVPEDHEMIIKK
jgi:hypothetical protein